MTTTSRRRLLRVVAAPSFTGFPVLAARGAPLSKPRRLALGAMASEEGEP